MKTSKRSGTASLVMGAMIFSGVAFAMSAFLIEETTLRVMLSLAFGGLFAAAAYWLRSYESVHGVEWRRKHSFSEFDSGGFTDPGDSVGDHGHGGHDAGHGGDCGCDGGHH